jgi:16S rRNA (guanine527-N7)-methyltransferase
VLDIGTGGGLPGIPLRIVTPSATVTLVDSIQKKIMVCNDIIEGLGLRGIRAIHGRAEEIARQKEHYRTYDVVVSRAVAPLDDLLKWTHDLLRLGGTLFSLKGGDLTEEIERSKKLKYVRSVQEVPLALQGYDDFLTEGKKLIRVECT